MEVYNNMPMSKTAYIGILAVVAVVFTIIGYGIGTFAASQQAAGTKTEETQPTGKPAQPEYTLHCAYITAPSFWDTHHFFFSVFEELVEKRTNGRVDIVLHPAASLGDQAKNLEQMAKGELFMATIEVTRFSPYTRELEFLSFPGLFRSTEEAIAFSESEWLLNYSNRVLNKFGWVVLGITVGGARYFLSIPEKPITGLESFQGLKLRVMKADSYIEAAKALGASPQTLPYAEMYTNLQQKVVDAMENEVAAIIAMRFYEVAPNIALIPWAYAWHFVVASKQVLESLPQDIRDIIITTAREVSRMKNAWGLYVEQTVGIEFLISKGARIIHVDTAPIFEKLEKDFLSREDFRKLIPQEALQWLENYRKSIQAPTS